MVRQQRAERTRTRLLRAAADEMDELGYCGASLNRTCESAGVTMGALTFHFPTKHRLAGAVIDAGMTSIRTTALGALRPGLPPLGQVRLLLAAVGGLLYRDSVVRATARLTRELPSSADWTEPWLSSAQQLIARARSKGQLRPGLDPADLTLLFAYLCYGAEAQARRRMAGTDTGAAVEAVRQLVDIWDAMLCGPADPGPSAGGSRRTAVP
ncbi:TetR family transcriptional regulator [Streptomyces sp. NPDC012389]|uniref:TetR family transcriptional regulator n=1 Tax=Streptomyces sp. NPDC012389 TaxID=3364830 RepID=UPI0036E133DF